MEILLNLLATVNRKVNILYYLSALYIGLIPLEAITVTEGMSYGRLVFYALAAISLLDLKNSFQVTADMKHIKILFVFMAYAAFTTLWSIDMARTFDQLAKLVQYMMITLVATNHAQNWKRLRGYMLAYCLGCLYIGYLSLTNYDPQAYLRDDEAGNPNENAFMINYAIVFLFIILNKDSMKNWMKCIFYGCIMLFSFFIFILGSRNGFIMLIITFITFLYSSVFRRFNFRNVIISIALIVGLYYMFQTLPETLIDRFLGISNSIDDNDFGGRGDIWDLTLAYLPNAGLKLIFGCGWGTFVQFFGQMTGRYQGAHNFFLTVLTTVGIIGFIIVLYYLKTLYNYLKKMISGKDKSLFIYYLLIILPLVSMMTTNWESRKWWFVISIFIFLLYKNERKGMLQCR